MSDEEGNETTAMQQMMGFSSFGTSQRPKKAAEPQEPTTGAFSASGANSAPLAKRAKTNNITSKIQPLSSSPPTFWPASLPPPPKSAASIGTTSSAQSYSTATELQPLPGASLSTQGSWYGPPPGRSIPSYSTQEARHTPALALGAFPSPSLQDSRYPPPGITVPTQSPQEPRLERPPAHPAYTNPNSGISLTQQELSELRKGKTNEKGDLVFFQPSFVDPDPWARPRKASGRVGY